ncbi:Hypothetical protein FKW44_002123 [Caligus rogercresseyi]|uniref:Uncharacterized protein n=1 Tax=Caligus rogercresseyi TaxID=217165 RepID=A0A7T8KJR2_CALRO|nr:Hypothetical protein FKW44_002123 [Caligus rogercresseyi]
MYRLPNFAGRPVEAVPQPQSQPPPRPPQATTFPLHPPTSTNPPRAESATAPNPHHPYDPLPPPLKERKNMRNNTLHPHP